MTYSFRGFPFCSGQCSTAAKAFTGFSSLVKNDEIQPPMPDYCFSIFASFKSYLNFTLFYFVNFLDVRFSFFYYLCEMLFFSRIVASVCGCSASILSSSIEDYSSRSIGCDFSFVGELTIND